MLVELKIKLDHRRSSLVTQYQKNVAQNVTPHQNSLTQNVTLPQKSVSQNVTPHKKNVTQILPLPIFAKGVRKSRKRRGKWAP